MLSYLEYVLGVCKSERNLQSSSGTVKLAGSKSSRAGSIGGRPAPKGWGKGLKDWAAPSASRISNRKAQEAEDLGCQGEGPFDISTSSLYSGETEAQRAGVRVLLGSCLLSTSEPLGT